jgi:hypothetical protein
VSKQQRAERKIEETKQKIDNKDKEIVDVGKKFTYAANYALSQDPTPNQYSKVAKEMTDRSLLATGNPSAEEAKELRNMVINLLSTNAYLKAKGEIELAQHDKELSKLQDQLETLQQKLDKAEHKELIVAKENSILAGKWSRLMFFIKCIFWTVIVVIVLRIVCLVLPEPYNNIGYLFDYIVGGIAKAFFKLLPKAKEAAGVVGSDVKQAFNGVVKGVGNALNTLDKEDIESTVSSKIPNGTTVDSATVKKLLEEHSENIAEMLRNELKVNTAGSRAVITQAQLDTGVKSA